VIRAPRGRLFLLAVLAIAAVLAAQTATVLLADGVKLGVDSGRYLGGAARLLDGEHLSATDRAYIGYIGVVAAARWLGAGPSGVVAFQIAMLALAAVAVFDVTRRLSGRWTALLAAGLFALFPDWGGSTGWQTYILTDSLFTCGIVFVVWAAVRCAAGARQGALVLILVLLPVCLLRPNGWLLVPLAGGWCLLQRARNRRRAWGVAIALAVVSPVLATAAGLTASPTLAPPNDALRSGIVVFGTNAWRASMPAGPPRRHG
jgi:hypothetical protein